jgi:CRISPR-associated protein Csd1
MILQRLYELAARESLLEDPAFVRAEVACLVAISKDGTFLPPVMDVRRREELPSKRKGSPPKVRLVGGRPVPVPVRPVVWDEVRQKWKTTDPAASGKEKPAVFLADTIARVLPVERLIADKDRAKFQAQRSTFWRFVRFVAEHTKDPAMLALAAFAANLDSAELQEQFAAEVEKHGLGLADLCTLAWEPDRGQVVLERDAVRAWWRQFYGSDFEAQQEGQYRGLCQVTQQVTAIAPSIKSKISGLIPVGCRAEAYLVTGLPSAESYELPGAVAGMVSPRGVDGFTRALNALIGNEFEGKTTSVRVGNVMFLFWTRRKVDPGVMALFEATEQQVKELFDSPASGKEYHGLEEENAFYLLSLSGNSARVVVRDYLERPLPFVRENLKTWFRQLTIADITRDGAGKPSNRFPLWQLVGATAAEMDRVAPDVSACLTHAALKGDPLPDSILAACLARLRAEGDAGFRRPARMALIKLALLRRKVAVTDVTETLNADEPHPAYVCGRLLAVFEEIQRAALGEVNATVTDKYFGTFSSAPAMVLGRLFANGQNHLAKLRGEKRGRYVALDKLLTEVSGKLKAPPRGQLTLEQQARFALGYYHQKAKQFEEIAERKAAKAAAGVT